MSGAFLGLFRVLALGLAVGADDDSTLTGVGERHGSAYARVRPRDDGNSILEAAHGVGCIKEVAAVMERVCNEGADGRIGG